MKNPIISLVAIMLVLSLVSATSTGYDVGDTVSDFKLKNVDGKLVSLSDYKDSKGVIIIFDCNTCPYSKAYNDRIIAMHRSFAPGGFPVITINSNDGKQSPGDAFDKMVEKAKRKNYDFPYLLDDTQRIARAFGATNTPHVFLLERNGNHFVTAYIGAIDNNARNGAQADKKYVEEAINALLAGKPVALKKTKAVGCGIKWKDA